MAAHSGSHLVGLAVALALGALEAELLAVAELVVFAFTGDADSGEQPQSSRTTGMVPCRRRGTGRSKPCRTAAGNFRVYDATATGPGFRFARDFFFTNT